LKLVLTDGKVKKIKGRNGEQVHEEGEKEFRINQNGIRMLTGQPKSL
jgi:hypothetical protein